MSVEVFTYAGKTYDFFLVEKILREYAAGSLSFSGTLEWRGTDHLDKVAKDVQLKKDRLSRSIAEYMSNLKSYNRMSAKGILSNFCLYSAGILTDVEATEARSYSHSSTQLLQLASNALERKRRSIQQDLAAAKSELERFQLVDEGLSKGECPRCHLPDRCLTSVVDVVSRIRAHGIDVPFGGDFATVLCGECCTDLAKHFICPACGQTCGTRGLFGLTENGSLGLDEEALQATLLVLPMLRWYLEKKGVSCEALRIADKLFACPTCVRRLLDGESRCRQHMDVSHKVHLVAGSTVSGTVTGFERLTTLVDLDGVPAILPLGELSWAYVVSPMDVVKVGSRYDFFIESIGSDCSKAVVSLRKLRPDPWLKVAEKYVCGTVTEGTVNRLSRNGDGAVLDLEHGVSGFLPIKEWPPRQTLEIKVGVKMKVRVTDIQPELRRMSLSAQFPAAQMHGPTHEFGKAKTKHKELARAIAMTIEDARKREVLIDGLNIARHYDELKSKALMLLVWELERNGFKWHIVFDANTAYWMMDANDVVGLKFLEYLKCEKPGSFDFCAAKTKADDCILQYADKYGNHVISCDGFSEYGDVYPWVLRLTESGRRVHPVSLVMGELQVPSLGLSISVGG